jgi:hypothetical protein
MAPKGTAIIIALLLVSHSGQGIAVIRPLISLALVIGLVKTFGLDLEVARSLHLKIEGGNTNEMFIIL